MQDSLRESNKDKNKVDSIQHIDSDEPKFKWLEADSFDVIGGVVALIWILYLLLANSLEFSNGNNLWNGIFFSGAGIIVLFISSLRLIVGNQNIKAIGGLFFGAALLYLGPDNMFALLCS